MTSRSRWKRSPVRRRAQAWLWRNPGALRRRDAGHFDSCLWCSYGADGGQWAAAGRQFVYYQDVQAYVVDVNPGPPFNVGPPRLLGVAPKELVSGAPTPDLKRIVASMPVGGTTAASLTVIVDWAAALRRN